MADGREKDEDILEPNWLSHWENQCVDDWENDSNMEELIQTETEQSSQKLWLSFQNSATSVSHLYKDGSQQNRVSLWVPFQNSASSVTRMFKDSQEAMKRGFDIGNQYGHHRRTKDILSWVKKNRRHIRREELIAFLCGKVPPTVVRHRGTPSLSRSASRVAIERSSPRLLAPSAPPKEDRSNEPDLQPFRDALALQGLNGAMSNISVERSGQGVQDPTAPGNAASNPGSGRDDFHYFILDEMARRCDSRKRPSTGGDVRVDSPNRKRSRQCCNETEDLC